MTTDGCHALPRFVDGEMPPEAQARFREHLAGCEPCSREFRDTLRLELLGQMTVRKVRLSRAQVVLLATCSAARTAPYLHEPFSLPVAFIEAGASVVLASTVDIPDTAGAFFEEVRELIRGKARPSAALRDARAGCKEHPDDAWWLVHVLLFE